MTANPQTPNGGQAVFAPPPSGDASEARQSRVLYVISLALAAGGAVMLVIGLLAGGLFLLPALLIAGAGAAGLVSLRTGRVDIGGYVAVGLLAAGFLAMLISPLLGGDFSLAAALSAPIWLGVLIATAGVLLGRRGLIATAAIGATVLAIALWRGAWATVVSVTLFDILFVAVGLAVLATVMALILRTAAEAQERAEASRRDLEQTRDALQGEIEERTEALALAAAVGRQITRVQDLDTLLQDAVELIREQFHLYHVQVYLLSANTQELILRAGTGEAGAELLRRAHRLPVGPGSINGTAAAGRDPVVVPQARKSTIFLPNPLLPGTQSEMAVPMIFEDEVVGTLNLQSDVPGGLEAADLPAYSLLAAQLATAVENARLFSEFTETREQLARQTETLTRDDWRGFLKEQPLELALGQPAGRGADELRQPISVRGTTIGYMELGAPGGETARARELTAAVAGQLGAHLENLRLTQQAEVALEEARRREEELAMLNDVVTAIAASADLQNSLQLIVDKLATATGIQQVGVAILNEERTALTVVADRSGSLKTDSAVGFVIPVENNPATQMAIAERRSVVVPNATENPLTASAHEVLRQRGVKTILILPLVVENQVIGTVGLDVVEEGIELTDDQLRLAETIVYQAASAVQRARLLDEIRARSRQLESLSRVEGNLSLATTEDEILLALAGGPPWSKPPALDLSYLSAGADGELQAEPAGRVADGQAIRLPEESQPANVMPLGALWRDKPRELLVIENAEEDARLDEAMRAQAEREGWRACVLLPLRRGGQWQGLLHLGWAEAYAPTTDEIFILQRLHEPLAATVAGRRAYLAQQAALARTEAALTAQARLSGELRAVSDVSVTAAATLDVDRLLTAAANLTKENFGLYHSHIYLLDEARTTLVLRAGAGAIGRRMVREGRAIPIAATSIVARAARERDVVLVQDTRDSTDFLPHPLLPGTRSEMAVPMIISDRLLGVLDVQSDEAGHFQPGDRQVYKILAAQLAVATQNAHYFAEQLEMAEKLREVDRLKTDFLARMSHELRTPLNSIIGFADVLLMGLDGDVTERMIEDLQHIRGGGYHLRDIIGDILDMSKIEAGRLELSYEPFDVRREASELMATAAPLAEQKGLALRLDIDEAVGPLTADRTRVRQVLWNIVGNAVKFTDHGGIVVAVRPDNGALLFSVTDTGIGIAPEHLPHIFDHFSQIDAGRRESISGTGLGLSISKSLVELHGGRIWAESEPARGSTFCFTIPNRPEAEEGSLSAVI